MEKSKQDQLVENLKESLNKALIELDEIENSGGYCEQSDALRVAIRTLLNDEAMKSEEEYDEMYSSQDYYDSGC